MADLRELEARLAALEDVEAIKRLKYRYWRCLDTKAWDEMAGCFAADATVSYGGGAYAFAGRDAIVAFLARALGRASGSHGVHHGHHPEIELTSPTTARGRWSLYNYLLNPGQERGVREAAYYDDQYVKVDGRWLLKHTGYTYLFHEEWSRAETRWVKVVLPE
jgi:uncharacterized protein (TIGR02246 family)